MKASAASAGILPAISATARKKIPAEINLNAQKVFRLPEAIFVDSMLALPAIEDFTQHLV